MLTGIATTRVTVAMITAQRPGQTLAIPSKSRNDSKQEYGQPGHIMMEENLGHTTLEQEESLQVKVEGFYNDTAKHSPAGNLAPTAEGAIMSSHTLSSPTKATSLLDELLAKSANLHQKLDKMTSKGQRAE